jgi:drug/metabolite transporter (DMT)-like permease
VTVIGDVFSLFGAISIIGYLHAGRYVRSWMPVFMYALPVTAVSAVVLTICAVLIEKTSWAGAGARAVFGYWRSGVFWYILYLALGPGIVGHTGFNFLLRFVSPFLVSMAFPLEPIVGSVLAWMAGLSPVPSALTWVGGAIMVAALTYCTYCESARVASRDKRRMVEMTTAETLNDANSLERVEMSAFTLDDEDDALVFDSL